MTRTSLVEDFSNSYYLCRFYIAPYDGSRAVIQQEQHEHMNEALYAEDDELARVDNPVVMKVDETYVPVHGDTDIPDDTLAVPTDLLEGLRVTNPPELKEVLLPKPDTVLDVFWAASNVVSDG